MTRTLPCAAHARGDGHGGHHRPPCAQLRYVDIAALMYQLT
jgi:hypothetical protein